MKNDYAPKSAWRNWENPPKSSIKADAQDFLKLGVGRQLRYNFSSSSVCFMFTYQGIRVPKICFMHGSGYVPNDVTTITSPFPGCDLSN